MKNYSLQLALLGLLVLTLAGWLLGHSFIGSWVVACVLALTFVKGQWLIDQFMGLRSAPPVFRWIVSAWLILLLGLTALFNI